jgi:hypothetical protein
MTAYKDGKREIEVEYKITPAEPTLLQKAAWDKFWGKMMSNIDQKSSDIRPNLAGGDEDNG